jgi:hypothetical protein
MEVFRQLVLTKTSSKFTFFGRGNSNRYTYLFKHFFKIILSEGNGDIRSGAMLGHETPLSLIVIHCGDLMTLCLAPWASTKKGTTYSTDSQRIRGALPKKI